MASKKKLRRDKISDLVLERGAMSVGALAEMLDVSTQTIRRDIDKLCASDHLRRVHGRVELAEQNSNTPFDQRAGTNLVSKRSIGEAAARLIPDGATLFIAIGSTPLNVAQALRWHKGLTVITNNLSAAMALSDEVSNRIILPGGEIRLPDRDILGDEAVDVFGRFRAEYAILSVAGVATDGRLLEFHTAEVRAAERILENAQRTILVVDHSKFGRTAPAVGANLTDYDHVILDRRPGAEFDALIGQIEDRLILTEGAE